MEKLIQTTEKYFRNGDLASATTEYIRQLQRYGIYLPVAANITWFECITYTTWQIIRMLIHRLPFGLWLSHKIGGLFCSNDIRSQAMTTYKEIGWILHRLNQIDLMETQNATDKITLKRKIYGIMVTLYAANMCETAEPIMYTKEMVEVYLAAALRIKSLNKLRLLAAYYLRKAKFYQLLGTTQNQKFDWIFSEHGYKFVSNMKSSFRSGGEQEEHEYQFSAIETNNMNLDPILHVQRKYCKYLLIKALESLLGFRKNTDAATKQTDNKNQQVHQSQVMNVLTFTQHLEEASGTDNNGDFLSIQWIAKIVAAASYWISIDLEKCTEQLYNEIDEFQHSLRATKNKEKTLLKSLYVIFIGKREFIYRTHSKSMTNDKLKLILNRCNIASCLLQNYLTYNRSQNINASPLIHLIEILVCDWLLELRTNCWEINQNSSIACCIDNDQGISEPYTPRVSPLQFYQMDLNNLYLIFDTKQMGQSRANLYEAIYRLMACAVPLETHRLLERNIMPLRQSKSNLICVVGGSKVNTDDYYVCGERERAQSMILACKYLQAQVGIERAGLLTQAATIFKQIGDIVKTNECYHLLNAVGTNGE